MRAGVGAALERAGHRPIVVTPGSRPTTALVAIPLVDTVLVVDQFEEVFTQCARAAERDRFFVGLAALATRMPGGDLACAPITSAGWPGIRSVARLVERGLYLLGPMTESGPAYRDHRTC